MPEVTGGNGGGGGGEILAGIFVRFDKCGGFSLTNKCHIAAFVVFGDYLLNDSQLVFAERLEVSFGRT